MKIIDINLSLVAKLIKEQFPKWSNLSINPVEFSGNDNRTFRLGEKMLIRLPSAEDYADQVKKEQKWLPILAQKLSFKIPTPVALGQPSKIYPWHWSIYLWIEGVSANVLNIEDSLLKSIAINLSEFLNEFHNIDVSNGPTPGAHNFWRGAHPIIYELETKESIAKLNGVISKNSALAAWAKATSSHWNKNPVWVHGDLSSGNILIKDCKLTSVIDFGCIAIGDPACDLAITWTFFKNESRKIFKSNLKLDNDTWARARGWALWKALITVVSFNGIETQKSKEQLQIINEILEEHEHEK
jgi:aminoglycoside phosphotransferase (APT) family kinase protein